MLKAHGNNTNINNTEYSKTNLILPFRWKGKGNAKNKTQALNIEIFNYNLKFTLFCDRMKRKKDKTRRNIMPVCYNKLWKILIDRGMSKTELIKVSKITTNAMAKLGKNEDVRVEVLVKICRTLNCTLDDIVDILPDDTVK